MSNALSSTSHLMAVPNTAQVHHQAAASLNAHCAEMAQMLQTDIEQDHVDQQALSCHLTDSMQTAGYCPDCSSSVCQSISVWLSPAFIPLSLVTTTTIPESQTVAYQAQHLAGFWQEILRPPKA